MLAYTAFDRSLSGVIFNMRVDLHIHTCASPDSLSTPDRILYWARRRKLDALAITDHDTIEVAREMASSGELPIIIGEEILTRDGEIIGLFLNEQVPQGANAKDTARYIHEQSGLVYLPHPYDSLRHSALHREVLAGLLPYIDLVEVFNARVLIPSENTKALQLARREKKPGGAGSDAHLACEVGRTYLELPQFSNCVEFTNALSSSHLCGRLASPLVHLGSSWARMVKHLR
jgi:predicted metal-dependent phosphoesterase TrpH